MGRKITEEDVTDAIASVEYLRPETTTATICIMKLKNGFVCEGFSACADPAEFNQELGEQIAYRNAFSKAWGFLGYGLVDQLYREQQELAKRGGTWQERVQEEMDELKVKAGKLQLMMTTSGKTFGRETMEMMQLQHRTMHAYINILDQRLILNRLGK